MDELEYTNIGTYWPNNPAFDPKKVLIRRLFFTNQERNKYVSVGFYPARDNLALLNEQLDAMAEGLPMLRDAMCSRKRLLGFAGARAAHFG
jgi:hypothetical protein